MPPVVTSTMTCDLSRRSRSRRSAAFRGLVARAARFTTVTALMAAAMSLLGGADGRAAAAAPPVRAATMSFGEHHGCGLLPESTVRCWGANSVGQVGDGTAFNDVPVATRVLGLSGVASVVSAGDRSCAIVADATARCWGANDFGQLGDGSLVNRTTPVPVSGLTGAVAISLGRTHSCSLMVGGSVKCWGSNGAGELGNGSTADSAVPVSVTGLTGATSIATGSAGSCAVTATAQVACWGAIYGGSAFTTPTAVAGLSGVKQMSIGYGFACALLTAGTVRCWGENFEGTLGDGTFTPSSSLVSVVGLAGVASIASARSHTCALLAGSGAVRCWGDGFGGKLGKRAPQGDGNDEPRPVDVFGLPPAIAIATGGDTSCAVVAPARVYCWGPHPYAVPGFPEWDYVPLLPARLADSRPNANTIDGTFAGFGRLKANSTTEVIVRGRGGVDVTASAALLTVTVVDPDAAGFVTVWQCAPNAPLSGRPNASNLNFRAGQTIANTASLELGDAGAVCIFSSAPTHVLIDVGGFYPAGTTFSARFFPYRLVDTRESSAAVAPPQNLPNPGALRAAGSTTEIGVEIELIPLAAAVLTVTVDAPASAGFLTVWSCGTPRPTASALNFASGQTIANTVTAAPGDHGRVCIYTSAATHLIVDMQGRFVAGAGLHAVPAARLLDSRPEGGTIDGLQARIGGRLAGTSTGVKVGGRAGVPTDATSAVLNVTVVDALAAGYLTVWPCGLSRPEASNVNFSVGDTIANAVFSGIGESGEICVFNSASTHLLVDVSAYEAG
jgi:alpha-tubulin suppressor-like RCC1 family protein